MLGNYKLENLLKLYLLVILLHLHIFEKGAFQANEAWKWRALAFTKLPMILQGEKFAFPLHSVHDCSPSQGYHQQEVCRHTSREAIR